MLFCTEMEKNSCMKEALVCLQEIGLCENTHGGEGHGSLDCSTRTRDANWPDGYPSRAQNCPGVQKCSPCANGLSAEVAGRIVLMCSVSIDLGQAS